VPLAAGDFRQTAAASIFYGQRKFNPRPDLALKSQQRQCVVERGEASAQAHPFVGGDRDIVMAGIPDFFLGTFPPAGDIPGWSGDVTDDWAKIVK
jgi:hypothetical protein